MPDFYYDAEFEGSPVQKLHKALAEFVKEIKGDEVYLQTWFLGFGTMGSAPNDLGMTSFSRSYAVCDDSPWSSYGLGKLALGDLKRDLEETTPCCREEDED